MATDQSSHVVHQEVPISLLDCRSAFDLLTVNEKLYAHHLSQAAWAGSLICLHQASAESPVVFDLLQRMFTFGQGATALKERCAQPPYNVSSDAYDQWLWYAVTFYGNLGNYYASGDLKFIPQCSVDDCDKIVQCAASGASSEEQREHFLNAWAQCRDSIFSLEKGQEMVGWPPAGRCSYYSPDVTEADVQLVNAFCVSKGLPMSHQEINSRLWRRTTDDGKSVFELRLASSESRAPAVYQHESVEIHVVGSEYESYLKEVVSHIRSALPYVSNENQRLMLEDYIQHFQTGDVQPHIDSQRHWVDDKGTVVETQLGFIEPYRDPSGLRGEWQGTIAIQDKDCTAKFNKLVESAEALLKLFPWPQEFEKDVFRRPDFTSVEVLAFASTHIWAGQNLPNYDEVRGSYGFKNLSFGNVTRCSFSRKSGKKVRLLPDATGALYEKHMQCAFEIQVGIHELLGHGSGKLMTENADGTLNFDPSQVINPLTREKVDKWYKPGQTYAAVFSGFANAMEECRADTCALYLCNHPDVLEIFKVPIDERGELTYVHWVWFARSGLMALKYYSPEEKKWRQPHMQGNYAILRVMMEAGNGLVKINYDEQQQELTVDVDAALIESVGRPAIAQLLLKLHVHKSIADFEGASEYFLGLTQVSDDMLKLRPIVLANQPPEGVFVQCNTTIAADGSVQLHEYPATAEGMVQSFLDRFPLHC